MKFLFPTFLLNNYVEIYSTVRGEEGEEEKLIYKGKCIYDDKQKQIMSSDRQLIVLNGKIIVQGGLFFQSGYVIINNVKKNIYKISRPQNVDGSVYSTELDLGMNIKGKS
jgi:hypothetical protein